MKNLLIMVLLPFFSMGQDIKENGIDQFTKQHRVQTKATVLKSGLSCGLQVYFRSVDTTFFVIMEGYGCGADVINTNDQVFFLLLGDSVVKANSTGIQSYDVGKYNNTYQHQYSITRKEIEVLGKNSIKAIRKYSGSGYADIELPEKNMDKIGKLANALLKVAPEGN